MPRHRSSIFSSDTLDNTSTPRDWWLTVGLALLLIAAAEVALRALLGLGLAAPDYWDATAGVKYEWYRAQEKAPDVLIIGDSSAARNFSPPAMEQTLGGRDAFNLGTPGNFPLALQDTAVAMLRRASVPEVVIVSEVAHAYYDSDYVDGRETPIRRSRAARYFNDNKHPTDYLVLARLYDHRGRLVQKLLGKDPGQPAPPNKGFLSDRQKPVPLRVPDGYFDWTDPSRERLETITTLARIAADRQIKLIFALPVQLDAPAQPRVERHRQWLLDRSEEFSFAVVDMRTITQLEHTDFMDVFHLSPVGAKRQSRALGKVLNACLAVENWRICLAERPLYEIETVGDPTWIPTTHASSE